MVEATLPSQKLKRSSDFKGLRLGQISLLQTVKNNVSVILALRIQALNVCD